MRMTTFLAQVAALVAASACGSGTTAGGDRDAAAEGSSCVGPCCGSNAPPPQHVSAATACTMIEQTRAIQTFVYGAACAQTCGNGYQCNLPATFVQQVEAANGDAGQIDGGPIDCPTVSGDVTVTCFQQCTGRLTAGYTAPRSQGATDRGHRFAAMAYLEAVSVHAFDRLARELGAHGAPPPLLREARRARRDEIRHTAMTARLARRSGAPLRLPEAPSPSDVRPLFEVALENAVEGCVRETYGAVVGLVEAQTSSDGLVRRTMSTIAADECRHAELAWAVHAWAMARLPSGDRRRVEHAMRDAVAELAQSDVRVTSRLFAQGPLAAAWAA